MRQCKALSYKRTTLITRADLTRAPLWGWIRFSDSLYGRFICSFPPSAFANDIAI